MRDPRSNDSFMRFQNMINRQGAAPSSDYGLGTGAPGVAFGGSSYGASEDGSGNPPLDQ